MIVNNIREAERQRGREEREMKRTTIKKNSLIKMFITIYSMQIEVNRYKMQLTFVQTDFLIIHANTEFSIVSFPVEKTNPN